MGDAKVWWLLAAGAALLAIATHMEGENWNGWTVVFAVLAAGLAVGALVATYPTAAGLPARTPAQPRTQPPSLPPVQTSAAQILGNSSVKGGTASPGVERLFVPPPLPKP